MRLSDLSFSVPGALVQLAGTYTLKTQEVDFHGTLSLDAKVSETTTGIKSVLLKVVDPLFKRSGGKGSLIPIKIGGTSKDLSFGLDLKRRKQPRK